MKTIHDILDATFDPNFDDLAGGQSDYDHFLIAEAKALLSRLKMVYPFSLTMPMVGAANVPVEAWRAINDLIEKDVGLLEKKIRKYIRYIKSRPQVPAERLQKDFSLLKLQFNSLLDGIDIFGDVLTQRSEHFTGVWLSGLDYLAEDALTLKGNYFELPPLICYLDRGHGAAIRRARTRLPGGRSNPVGVIRVPRERMISSGIAPSLIHETGHQGSALLNLIPSLRPVLRKKANQAGEDSMAWLLFERWLSEILSDFWAMANLGVGATYGLIGVVSLPAYFVFRVNLDDPHPFPWIRVKISCGFGKILFPDQQWDKLDQLWENLYPTKSLGSDKQELIRSIEHSIPAFVRLVIQHRPASLRGKRLKEVFPYRERKPSILRRQYRQWEQSPWKMKKARPGLVFAVIGQARADQRISPEKENKVLTQLLQFWAVKKLISKR